MMKQILFYKKVATIAAPIALQQLVISSLNMIDVFMISSLSNEAIAGVGGANKLYFLFNLFLFGMSSGSAILTAQYWGAKDRRNIQRVYGISLTVGILASSVFALFAILTPEWVMHFFSTDLLVIEEGCKYLRIIGFSYIFTAVSYANVFILRSTGEVRIPLYVSAFAILVNTFLNWVLIFGKFYFPAMGVAGAAYATLISRFLESVLLITISQVKHLPPSGRFSEIFSFSGSLFRRFLVIAGPTTANELIWASGITMYAVVYGKMGTDVVSAMTIFQTMEQMVFVLVMGIANSAAIILGNTLGENKLEKAYQESMQFLRLATYVAIFLCVTIALLAEFTTSLFPLTETVHRYVVNSLYVLSIAIFPRTINTLTIVGILRSGGDTMFTAIIDGIGVWIVGVPLAFISGIILQWEIWFVVAAITMDEVVKVILSLMRTFSKKWLRNLAQE